MSRSLCGLLATISFIALAANPTTIAAAEITSVEPAEVAIRGGTPITIHGSGFRGDIVAFLGPEEVLRLQVVDGRTLTGTSPALRAGIYSLALLSPGQRLPLATLPRAVTAAGRTPLERDLFRLERDSETPTRTLLRPRRSNVVQMRYRVDGGDCRERADRFLDTFPGLFELDSPDFGLLLHRVHTPRLPGDGNEESATYQQTWRGLQIHGAGAWIGLQGDRVHLVSTHLMPASRIGLDGFDPLPAISREAAEQLATEHEREFRGQRETPPVFGESTLLIFSIGLLNERAPLDPRLAWRVSVGGSDPSRVFVDAHDGGVLFRVETTEESGDPDHGFDLVVHDGMDIFETEYGCGVFLLAPFIGEERFIDAAYDDADGEAHSGRSTLRQTYEYYHERFVRHSYNGLFAQNRLLIHSAHGNASWNPTCGSIEFRRGWMCRDIMGHEFTHGVISAFSNLEYSFQSGALNESFADVMGNYVDHFEGDVNYVHGENRSGGGGAIRSIENPSKHESLPQCPTCAVQPDVIWDLDYKHASIGGFEYYEDHGGVHFNSGIPNKAAYLMDQGGVHPWTGVVVAGMGPQKTQRLLMRAMIHLPYFANFTIAAATEIAFAENWAQNNELGFTAQDVCTVENAWAAVGVLPFDSECAQSLPTPIDADDDGTPTVVDNCPDVANPGQADSDHDGIGDACDDFTDQDYDGFADDVDTCPTAWNPYQGSCADLDGDGAWNSLDNCKNEPNPDQLDSDGDGEGDACSPDPDGDLVFTYDNCPMDPNPDQADSDDDGFGDACDGCPDDADGAVAFGLDGKPYQPDSDGDGIPDLCDESLSIEGHLGGIVPGSGLSRITVSRGPTGIHRVPILTDCPPDCPEETAPGRFVTYRLEGLDGNLSTVIRDELGNLVARSANNTASERAELTFERRGGTRYFLELEFAPDAPPDSRTDFEIQLETSRTPPEEPPVEPTGFRRGDAGADGVVDISDAVFILGSLFLTLEEDQIACHDSADSNNDGTVDISDAVNILGVLFVGQGRIPAPGRLECGADPTADGVDCANYRACAKAK